jgi:aspartate/methionine/tyrosine aminotransferase
MNIDIIKPTAAVALADIARKMELDGKKVIKLQTGDPDFATHRSIIEAANASLLAGHTHYSFSQGLPLLRKQIAQQ